jgi:hypothetical protein
MIAEVLKLFFWGEVLSVFWRWGASVSDFGPENFFVLRNFCGLFLVGELIFWGDFFGVIVVEG